MIRGLKLLPSATRRKPKKSLKQGTTATDGMTAGVRRLRGLCPIYSFSKRVSVEERTPDGWVKKTTVFRHVGFVGRELPMDWEPERNKLLREVIV